VLTGKEILIDPNTIKTNMYFKSGDNDAVELLSTDPVKTKYNIKDDDFIEWLGDGVTFEITDIEFNYLMGVDVLINVQKYYINLLNTEICEIDNSIGFFGNMRNGTINKNATEQTIKYLDLLFDDYVDSSEGKLKTIFLKILMTFMFKHSGDTCQMYVGDICNTFVYTEDTMLIACGLLGGHKLVTGIQLNNKTIVDGSHTSAVDVYKQLPQLDGLIRNKLILTHGITNKLLREYFDETSRDKLLERKASEADSLIKIEAAVPYPIYIG
jgi:hypothetical protein